jgi:hypothetical protein
VRNDYGTEQEAWALKGLEETWEKKIPTLVYRRFLFFGPKDRNSTTFLNVIVLLPKYTVSRHGSFVSLLGMKHWCPIAQLNRSTDCDT